MGLLIELVQGAFGHGTLALGNNKQRLQDLKPLFKEAGQAYNIPAPVLAGIAWTESSFRPEVVNSIGCVGLMQVCPVHFGTPFQTPIGEIVPNESNLKDPRINVFIGGRILELSGWHTDGPYKALKNWGGFKTKDPNPYITDVLNRATFLAPGFFLNP